MIETETLYAEVSRRKTRAKALKLPETVFENYCELARWYPESVKLSPSYIPDCVSDVQRKGKDVEFSLGENRYAYQWREDGGFDADGKAVRYAHLDLTVNGRLVFGIGVSGSPTTFVYDYVFWIPRDVESFVEGPWVNAIHALAQEIERLRAEVKREEERRRRDEELRQRQDPRHLAELKERFGIDVIEPAKSEPTKTRWWKRKGRRREALI
jgi:hypothetical protein